MAGVALSAFAPGLAHAQGEPPARDPIAAETLFTRGKQLMEQGKTNEACDAFAESQRLDPAGGTLLRLALCHEAQGKLASAWLDFTEVVRISKDAEAAKGESAKFAERVRMARQHLEALEPKMPKLVVNVAPGARVDGLHVTANGLPRNEGTWGVAIPVDAGDVEVVASAPGRRTFRTLVHADQGRESTVAVPVLEVEEAVVPPEPPAPPTAEQPDTATAGASALRPIGIGIGAAGVVSVGIGAYFGFRAISKWNDSNGQCVGALCSAGGLSLANDAKQAAVISDVTIASGIVAVAAGVTLFVLGAPKNVQPSGNGLAFAF